MLEPGELTEVTDALVVVAFFEAEAVAEVVAVEDLKAESVEIDTTFAFFLVPVEVALEVAELVAVEAP